MSQQPPLQSPPAPTVRDEIAVTRLDGPAPTVRDGALSPRTLMQLPSALAGRYRIVQPLPAGGEADLLLVEAADGQRCVAKIYRYGIQVKTEVLDRLVRAGSEAVARLLEYGQSDGHGYEVLEYLPEGSLRSRLAVGPLAEEQARALVVELSAALALLHEHDILHRDLKPENVLIRQWQPLRIALTDFGIASVAEATQHFTTVARTLRYAAPEAATGVIGRAADYWSLGMLVLEALSGRHPFAGLSDAVLSYQLVTQPVDCGGVAEPWRMLCRGLLLRNPKQRWGRAEVERWLAGDASLRLLVEDSPSAELRAQRPYRLGGVECRTARELAVQMARQWEVASKDLGRGFITDWLRNELHDQDLARAVLDVLDDSAMSADERLLRVLVKMAPDLPPVWKQWSLAKEDLIAVANAATSGDNHSQTWLAEVYQYDVLAIYAAAGNNECREIGDKWRQAVVEYKQTWSEMIKQGVSDKICPDQATLLPALLLVTSSPPFCKQLKIKIDKSVNKLKNPPAYLQNWLNKPISGMSLALCSVIESLLRLEPMLSKLAKFREEFSILGESREFNADLTELENSVYAGVYNDPAKFQEALNALKIKIQPLDESVRQYQKLLEDFTCKLSEILRYKNLNEAVQNLNEAVQNLNKTIQCLDVALRESPSVAMSRCERVARALELLNSFAQEKMSESQDP